MVYWTSFTRIAVYITHLFCFYAGGKYPSLVLNISTETQTACAKVIPYCKNLDAYNCVDSLPTWINLYETETKAELRREWGP